MWWSKKREDDLDRELRSHLESEMQEQGSLDSAKRAFGNTARVKEDVRAAWGWTSLERFAQDLRYALRMLRKSPNFTVAAVLSLALGIGANTAIFSLIDAVLLRMLPVQHPEQLVILDCLSRNSTRGSFSHADFEWIRDRNQVFSGVAASAEWRVDWKSQNRTSRIVSGLVSEEFFQVLGVEPAAGRLIAPKDDSVAVISHAFWQREFALDPSVLGRTLELGNMPFRIIGVAPETFTGVAVGGNPEVWLPLSAQPQLNPGNNFLHRRDQGWLELMARLRPAVTQQQVRASLSVLLPAVQAELRIDPRNDSLNHIGVSPGAGGFSYLRERYTQALQVLMGVVALVLLIACLNVSNLLLARAVARQREFAVRLAIGASRPRLIRQLLTESLALALMAGGLGVAIAYFLTRLLLRMADTTALDVSMNPKILTFTAAVSILTAVLFGMAPAMRAASPRVRGWNLSRVLVAAQIAVCLMLLITAGLFTRSLQNLHNSDTGFDRVNVVQIHIETPEQTPHLVDRLIASLEAVPGVQSASASSIAFGHGQSRTCCVFVKGRIAPPDEDKVVRDQKVSPGYFRTMGTPLLAGRDFTATDVQGSPEVAIVNETMARQYFGRENPIGRRFGWIPHEAAKIEIVGVVKDARYDSLRETSPPMVYQSFAQRAGNPDFIQTRVAGASVFGNMADLRSAIKAVDGRLPILETTTMGAEVDRSLSQERLVARLAGAFGLLALTLAALGLYGVVSYAVTRRTSEIGLRIALGGQLRHIKQLVLRETIVLSLTGIVAGILGAAAAQGLIATQLFGLTPTDPTVLAGSAAVLLAVGAVAGFIPARRASKIEPLVALRYE
jgi:predicted permease